MALVKLALLPSQASYSATTQPGFETTRSRGGPSRRRRAYYNNPRWVDCSFAVGAIAYAYLQAFWFETTQEGTLPFLIDLILDEAGLLEYEAAFSSDGLRLAEQRGNLYTVSCQLEVTYRGRDPIADQALVESYNLYAESVNGIIDQLAETVNLAAPDALP